MSTTRSTARWLTIAALGCAATVAAQQPPQTGAPTPPPGLMEKLRVEQERYRGMPDMPGTGPLPAVKEEVAGLPDHVVYRPADLSKVRPGQLGILVWGNGGCEADGASGRFHLSQIVSHGYLAIANGRILSGPGAPPRPRPPAPEPGKPMTLPPPATTTAQLTQAIDWAIAENKRPGSPLFGKLNTTQVAVSGWSCGGLQALQIAAGDPRIRAVVIHNSGIFNSGSPIPGLNVDKSLLDRLHTPILYVLGGPSDIAYVNGMDDYARITKVPAAVANLGDVGHGGSFTQPNGGKAALIDVDWLDWQLKGDPAAERKFRGPDCAYCRDPAWKFQKKGF